MLEGQRSLDQLFDELLVQRRIFKNKEVLRDSYTPSLLPHRDRQVDELATILVSAMQGETPSNVFIYGKTGTGKTAVTVHVGEGLVRKVGGCCFIRPYGTKKEVKKEKENISLPVWFIYTNCEIVDTQYRLLAKLAEYMGQSVPLTGWPTDKVYESFVRALDREERLVIVVLDEIDRLLRKGSDSVLYNLTRINSDLKRAKVSIIGISNDLNFIEFLDPRVRSSLGEEELVFPPYHAEQLVDILSHRAEEAFCELALDQGVIPLCAAFAAQEHGDARRALDFLRIAGEVSERERAAKVTERHVRIAKNRIEQDRVAEVIKTFPTQSKFVLFAIMLLEKYNASTITTGETYNVYRELCRLSKIDTLTQRRVSDIISELDMMGIVNATVVSKGRYGRTKEIRLGVPIGQVRSVLEKHHKIERISSFVPPVQRKLV
ncbi:MAG: ORC1-type DNA replication protein [Theionarchaea archaeon]|nr:ORC1-type DNA replication protein [Theionarchaea archaeon]